MKKCYRRIALCDTETGKEYTDLLEMHILELSKLPPEQKNETDLLQWMRFLGGKCREDFKKMAENNSTFEEAYDVLDRLSADEKKRLEYEARQKAIRDHDIMMKTAKKTWTRGWNCRGKRKGNCRGKRNKKNAILFVKCCRITFPIIKLNNIQEQQIKRFPRKRAGCFKCLRLLLEGSEIYRSYMIKNSR